MTKCGTYLDSKAKLSESNYKAGIKNYDNGNFAKAVEYLEKNTNYLDSSAYLEASKKLNQMQGIWKGGSSATWSCYLIVGWKVSIYDRWGKFEGTTKIKLENGIYSNYDFKDGKVIRIGAISSTALSFWEKGTSISVPKIGMTAAEAKETIWGIPSKINTTTNSYGVSEQWVYYDYHYLYFTNGKLTSISS